MSSVARSPSSWPCGVIVAVAVALCLSGCGGDGGGSTASGTPAATPTPVATAPTPAAPAPCAGSVAGDGIVPYPTDTAAYPVTGGLYERPETAITVLGANDGVANSYSDPFPGSLGGAYLLFYRNSNVTLTGKGYVTVRWEYAYFNRGGVLGQTNAATVTAAPGSFVKKVAGGARFMPDPTLDGVPGSTGFWRPGTNFTPITIADAVTTGWQNEYYYIDGAVTFTNHESGLDYNLSITPISGANVRRDVGSTWVGSAANIQRPALLLDPYDGSSKPASPTQLSASVVSDSRVAVTWSDCATTEQGYQVEVSYAGDWGDEGKVKHYDVGELYTLVGSYPAGTSAATIATLSPSTKYRMRVKAYNAAGDSAYSNTVDFTTPAAVTTLPSPYVQYDVATGPLPTAGTASVSNGNYVLRAASGDIYGTADSFSFVHRPMTGDGTMTARVLGMTYTHKTAKSGIMMRDGLDPRAIYAMTTYQPVSDLVGQRRNSVGGSTSITGVVPARSDKTQWIRLIRKGNLFTMQSSPDGTTWTTFGSTTIAMSATINVGLVVSSISAGVATVTFDNVSFTQP